MTSTEVEAALNWAYHEFCIRLCKIYGGTYLDKNGYLWKIVDGQEIGKPSIQMPDLRREWCENLSEKELRYAIDNNSTNLKKWLERNNPKLIPKKYIINRDRLSTHIQETGINNLYKVSNVAWNNLYWINKSTDYNKYKRNHFSDGLYSAQEQVKQHQDILKAIRYGIKHKFVEYEYV